MTIQRLTLKVLILKSHPLLNLLCKPLSNTNKDSRSLVTSSAWPPTMASSINKHNCIKEVTVHLDNIIFFPAMTKESKDCFGSCYFVVSWRSYRMLFQYVMRKMFVRWILVRAQLSLCRDPTGGDDLDYRL